MVSGAGAGAKATIGSVLSDLIKIQNTEKKIDIEQNT